MVDTGTKELAKKLTFEGGVGDVTTDDDDVSSLATTTPRRKKTRRKKEPRRSLARKRIRKRRV